MKMLAAFLLATTVTTRAVAQQSTDHPLKGWQFSGVTQVTERPIYPDYSEFDLLLAQEIEQVRSAYERTPNTNPTLRKQLGDVLDALYNLNRNVTGAQRSIAVDALKRNRAQIDAMLAQAPPEPTPEQQAQRYASQLDEAVKGTRK